MILIVNCHYFSNSFFKTYFIFILFLLNYAKTNAFHTQVFTCNVLWWTQAIASISNEQGSNQPALARKYGVTEFGSFLTILYLVS